MAEFLDFPEGYGSPNPEIPEVSPGVNPSESDPSAWFIEKLYEARTQYATFSEQFMADLYTVEISENLSWVTNAGDTALDPWVMYYSSLRDKGYEVEFRPHGFGDEPRTSTDVAIFASSDADGVVDTITRRDNLPKNELLQEVLRGFMHGPYIGAARRGELIVGQDVPPMRIPSDSWKLDLGLDMVNRSCMTSIVLSQATDNLIPEIADTYKKLYDSGFRPFTPEALYGMAEDVVKRAIRISQLATKVEPEES